mgnify:CR=1 FL=1
MRKSSARQGLEPFGQASSSPSSAAIMIRASPQLQLWQHRFPQRISPSFHLPNRILKHWIRRRPSLQIKTRQIFPCKIICGIAVWWAIMTKSWMILSTWQLKRKWKPCSPPESRWIQKYIIRRDLKEQCLRNPEISNNKTRNNNRNKVFMSLYLRFWSLGLFFLSFDQLVKSSTYFTETKA